MSETINGEECTSRWRGRLGEDAAGEEGERFLTHVKCENVGPWSWKKCNLISGGSFGLILHKRVKAHFFLELNNEGASC